MHDTVAHSAVSDALVKFALGRVPGQADAALEAARRAVARARTLGADDAHEDVARLLRSQGSPHDARVQAWTLGALLAGDAPSSPAAAVVAAAVTMGDRLAATEKQIAAAAAIGIEAAARVQRAVDSSEYRARWNVASSLGVLGASLAVARLLGLDEDRTRHALGVAATQAAGLARNAGEAMEAVEIGKAAADAIEAALIAKHGFTSAPASIDGRRGFAALMAYRFDAGAIVVGDEAEWVTSV
ncbi:MmgE/PrpD family protein [Paraburkholderia sp.]|uniref:MmgE/PrpD family protein n=1 Tax=Paraburkholderia sp. TaxID=1926495 RepID=UPI003D6E9B0A